MPGPGAINGGPISLPHRLSLDLQAARLVQSPATDHAPTKSWKWDGMEPFTLDVGGHDCTLAVRLDSAGIAVTRSSNLFEWHRGEEIAIAAPQTIDLYEDTGLIELFILPIGLTVTAFLPDACL